MERHTRRQDESGAGIESEKTELSNIANFLVDYLPKLPAWAREGLARRIMVGETPLDQQQHLRLRETRNKFRAALGKIIDEEAQKKNSA